MPLSVRRAEEGDWARLFSWRNDAATLAASKSTDAVPLADHLKWLRATLARDSVRLYVFEDQSVSLHVGTGRLDRLNQSAVELSLTVAPEARGRGYAAQMVQRLAYVAPREFEGVTTLKAEVREHNYASLRAFAEAGFAVERTKDGLVQLAKKAEQAKKAEDA